MDVATFHSHYSSLRRWGDDRLPSQLKEKKAKILSKYEKEKGRDGHLHSQYYSLKGWGDVRLHSSYSSVRGWGDDHSPS